MEKIQSHDIKDIWRVRDGLLVEVYKYESVSNYNCYSYPKKSFKIVRGCKGLTISKEDITDNFRDETHPTGTLFYHGTPVKPITDVSKFKAEIKSSGGSVIGSISEMGKLLKDIELILNKY
ncbi:MAG: hypothetical protein WD512_15040 [Candidatus Paceibacterota bacterium]